MRVIIAGGRNFRNYRLLKEYCDKILQNQKEVVILSGRCHTGALTFTTSEGVNVYGADGLGERYAKEKGYKVLPFPADWKAYDKAAGPIRNQQMAESADALIAFWDGKSKGTKNMIECATYRGLKVRVKKVKDNKPEPKKREEWVWMKKLR